MSSNSNSNSITLNDILNNKLDYIANLKQEAKKTIFKNALIKNKNKLNISFVTKKKLGTAVIRNKIKRKLRNITNEAVKSLSLRLDYSYLVIAKETVLKNDYLDIKKTMFNEFNKIK